MLNCLFGCLYEKSILNYLCEIFKCKCILRILYLRYLLLYYNIFVANKNVSKLSIFLQWCRTRTGVRWSVTPSPAACSKQATEQRASSRLSCLPAAVTSAATGVPRARLFPPACSVSPGRCSTQAKASRLWGQLTRIASCKLWQQPVPAQRTVGHRPNHRRIVSVACSLSHDWFIVTSNISLNRRLAIYGRAINSVSPFSITTPLPSTHPFNLISRYTHSPTLFLRFSAFVFTRTLFCVDPNTITDL